ncbi:MAG TPA: hypothetical protein DCY13_20545, partial [Verrucomicrobiales bacterium]|nr:hypothetical protein [Verrucomicrobiales bacterium]
MNDFKFALRQLLKNPGYTLIVVLVLGLGVAINTAIFTVTNAVLFRPVPAVPQQDRLVQMLRSHEGGRQSQMAYADFLHFREHSQSFDGLAAFRDAPMGLGYADETERIRGDVVSGSFFEVLRVPMVAGRSFLPEEDGALEAHPVAVISHRLWQRRFGGRPEVVGERVELNGSAFTVIGVTARGFLGLNRKDPTDVWVPMAMIRSALPSMEDPAKLMNSHEIVWHGVVGRLRDGVTLGRAQAEIDSLFQPILDRLPQQAAEMRIQLVSGIGVIAWAKARLNLFFILLQCVVGLVLIVACANVANLQLARGVKRTRELGIRYSLGATRWRIVRSLLVENVMLALLAASVGALLSMWFIQGTTRLLPASVVLDSITLTPDLRVCLFAGAIALVAAVGAGLFPALRVGRLSLIPTLKEFAALTGTRSSRLSNGFVVTQVTLSVILLLGAGLFLRSVQHAVHVDPGMNVSRVAIGSLDLGMRGYDEARGRRFYDELLERVRALPGVQSAGLAPFAPFSGAGFFAPLESVPADGAAPVAMQVNFTAVTPDWLDTLELPVLAGRG